MLRSNLTAALLPIDLHWAIEARWAEVAKRELDRIDWSEHAREFLQGAEARRTSQADPEEDERPYQVADGVALLSLTGPMTKRPQSWGRGTSTVQLRRSVRQAAADPEVKSIVLVIDSPGGQVSGTYDLAADVAKANQRKPVVAYLEDLAASAAYAVASQAGAVYANENALVGCIGTYTVLYDTSRLAENEGVKVHVIRAGRFKGAGAPGTQVTDEQLAAFQREVDSLNEVFLNAVATGRKLPRETVESLADGRVHVASQAKTLGLIDGVLSLDRIVSELQEGRYPAGWMARDAREGEGEAMSKKPGFIARFQQFLAGEGIEVEGEEQAKGAPAAPPAVPPSLSYDGKQFASEQALADYVEQKAAAKTRATGLQSEAASFADSLKDRIVPAARAGIITGYVAVAQAGDETALTGYKTGIQALPKHGLRDEQVSGRMPAGAMMLPEAGGDAESLETVAANAKAWAEQQNGAKSAGGSR